MRNKLFVILAAAGLAFLAVTALSPVKRDIMAGRRINLLVAGVSESGGSRSLEALNLISYEPVTGFIDSLAIPEATMIGVPHEITWRRVQRLDEVFARIYRECSGDSTEVISGMKRVVEELLGGRVEIGYHLVFDYAAFEDLVDALGGITIEVHEHMEYEDRSAGLLIDIPAGLQELCGAQALNYVRYRGGARGDAGRRERHQVFKEAVARKLKASSSVLRSPAIVRAVLSNVETNLNAPDVLALTDELRGTGMRNFRKQVLDGETVTRWGRDYWAVNRDILGDVIDIVANSHLLNMPRAPADREALASRRITAEVWNATNRPGLARDLTEYLRRRNVDVVRYGNFGAFRKHTQIISRTGDLNTAREVAIIIGCRNIVTDIDMGRMVDINVVIGSDIKELWRE